MKFRVLTGLIVTAFLLTGCYTQLRYTTVYEKAAQKGYTWSGEEKEPEELTEADSAYIEGFEDGVGYYLDYEAANWYARHGLNDYYLYDLYRSHYAGYHPHYHYHPYPRSRFRISVSFGYGSHFGHYYDPFAYYGGYYDYYAWPPAPYYFNPYIHNTFVFTGFFPGTISGDNGRTYGRRATIGTNRVRSGKTGITRDTRRSKSRVTNNTGRRTTRVKERGKSRRVKSDGSSGRRKVRSTGRSKSRSSDSKSVRRSRNRPDDTGAVSSNRRYGVGRSYKYEDSGSPSRIKSRRTEKFDGTLDKTKRQRNKFFRGFRNSLRFEIFNPRYQSDTRTSRSRNYNNAKKRSKTRVTSGNKRSKSRSAVRSSKRSSSNKNSSGKRSRRN